MRELNEEYSSKLRHAIVKAICEASVPEGEGIERGNTLYIGTAEVCEVLTFLLAEFLEGAPNMTSPSDVRAMSETIAKKLRIAIAEIRRSRAETGSKPLPSIVIRSN